MSTAAQVLAVARSQLGYREGRNDSNKYGRWFGMDNAPYCDMWVSWVAHQAGAGGIVGKFAYTPWHAAWFRGQGRWGHTPRVGAIVFFDWGKGIAHVGIVESVRPDGAIVTIEGNTNLGGSSSGAGVYRLIRKAHIAGYGYPAYATSTPPPPAPRWNRVRGPSGVWRYETVPGAFDSRHVPPPVDGFSRQFDATRRVWTASRG